MNYRIANLIGLLTCVGLLGAALFYQHIGGLEPCPLCTFQRLAFSIMALVFLLAFIVNPENVGRKIFGFLTILSGLFGVSVGIRHLWLQSLPADQVPSCGPGLDYMLDVFPLSEVLRQVFSGSGECAEIDWVFLGLSMPAWALIWITALMIFGAWNAFRTLPYSKTASV